MADKSTVKVTFLGEASQLAGAARKARGEIDSVGRQAERSSGRMKGAFGGMGKAAKAGLWGLVGGSAAAAGAKIFDLASQMELMDNKSSVVFGNQINVVKKWAKANANAMGLTSKEATGLAANFADLLIPMGFTRQEAAKMSTNVVGLSGALAQWSGGKRTAAEVSEILAKAMLGERDGLKELGISISEADVQARLAKMGKDKLTGAALEQAKAEATQALIMEKSTDAQAAYAKNTGTLAAQKARLTARIKELRDNAIAFLIPKLVQLGKWINENVVPAVKRLVQGFRDGSGTGGSLRKVVDDVKAAFERNKPQIKQVLEVLGKLAGFIGKTVIPILVKLEGKKFSTILDAVGKLVRAFNAVRDAVQDVIEKVQDLIAKAKNIPGAGLVGKAGGLLSNLPGFAAGTRSAPAGLAVVGEEGPELMQLRGGERIWPTGTGPRVAGGGGGAEPPIIVQLVLDGKVIQESLLRRKRTLGGNLGLA